MNNNENDQNGQNNEKKPNKVLMTETNYVDSLNDYIEKTQQLYGSGPLSTVIKTATGSTTGKVVPRLAFTESPINRDNFAGIFKNRASSLLPDYILKKIRNQNLLVAAILRARGNSLSLMGNLKKDRFDAGISVQIREDFKKHIEPEQMVVIQERIDKFTKLLLNCGHYEGLSEKQRMTLSEFLDIQSREGLTFGWFGTEIVKDENGEFHRFRPIDAGTVRHAIKKGEAAKSIRQAAIQYLAELNQANASDVKAVSVERDRYDWIQVIDGMPRQGFASDELLMYNLYPSIDIDHKGYPITPIDTVISSITTHTSIEVYNRLYFQNGRGAKGMLVIRSDEIQQGHLEDIKQQFNASINDVTKAFRVPVFGVGKEDDVQWVLTQPNKRDGEFEYLFDQTTRNILSSFNMSPDELPGFSHLSKGTNSQALSESNNFYKLVASRDVGIRPLIMKIQDFLNRLFNIIDPELAQLCSVILSGIDAETREQENQRLSVEMPLHMTYDEVLESTDKDPIGAHFGGDVPFNQQYRMAIDTYSKVGDIIYKFYELNGSVVDPTLNYRRDQFFQAHMQALAQVNPSAYQAFYTTRKDAYKVMRFLLQDYLEELD